MAGDAGDVLSMGDHDRFIFWAMIVLAVIAVVGLGSFLLYHEYSLWEQIKSQYPARTVSASAVRRMRTGPREGT